jgi:hypothetical protein
MPPDVVALPHRIEDSRILGCAQNKGEAPMTTVKCSGTSKTFRTSGQGGWTLFDKQIFGFRFAHRFF